MTLSLLPPSRAAEFTERAVSLPYICIGGLQGSHQDAKSLIPVSRSFHELYPEPEVSQTSLEISLLFLPLLVFLDLPCHRDNELGQQW